MWGVGSTLAPYSRKQLWDYIDSYDGDIYSAKQLRLMIDLPGGETIGTVDLYDFDAANSRCAVGILIAPPYRRQGYGRAALDALADYCRTRLSLHQLYCIAGADNIASRTLFERAGYTISGRLRSWLRSANTYTDAYIYQKML